jgi:quinol monooxygenase YgiN
VQRAADGRTAVDRVDREHSRGLRRPGQPLMAETRKEDGCLQYCFTADLDDPGVVHVVERWESEAYLEPHMKAEHIRAFGRALKPVTIDGRDFTIYEVASEKKMG